MKDQNKKCANADCCSATDQSVEAMVEKSASIKGEEPNATQRWIENEKLLTIVSVTILTIGLTMETWIKPTWFDDVIRLIWYSIAYVPVGIPVAMKAVKFALKGELFTEFFLMTIATVGAFYIGEYLENQHVCILRPSHLLAPIFFSDLIASNVGQTQIWYYQQGGGREGLNFQSIKNFL